MSTTPEAGAIPPLVPSNTRLLHAVRSTLEELAARSDDSELRFTLAAADVALNELMLREDSEFFLRFYETTRALLDDGAAALDRARLPYRESLAEALTALPVRLDPAIGVTAAGAAINRLFRCGETLVRAARGSTIPEVREFVSRLMRAERQFHDHGASAAARPHGAGKRGITTPTALQAYLRDRWPERSDLVVTEFRRLTGGFQKITILFETEDARDGKQSYVMRADKDEQRFMILPAGDIADEYEVVKIAYAAGIPMAEPLWLEPDPAKLTRRFMVSRRVVGENYGSAVQTRMTMTDTALRSFMETLACIHRAPVGGFARTSLAPWFEHKTLADSTRAAVLTWQNQLFMGSANPSPMIARVFSWLLDNVPDEDGPGRLIHSDYGPHNILVRDERVAAVLDWEAPRIGDPAEDLSYFIQCTAAQTDPRMAIALYEAAAGYRISEYRLRYFDVYSLIKILIGSASAAAMFEATPDAGIEWCLLAFKYMAVVAGTIEDKIAAAEAAKGR